MTFRVKSLFNPRAIAATALVTAAAPALATPSSGFTAAQQWKGVYAPFNVSGTDGRVTTQLKTKDQSEIYVTRNAIAPGGYSGWHTHPGPSMVTVTVGSVKVYDGSDPICAWKTYNAGEGFLDEGGDHLHNVTNASGSEAAETVATQIVPVGATRRVDAPKPTNCPF